MGMVEELQEAAGGVVRTVGPSVVRIGRGWGRGAGVVVGDGLVVTNAHNLRGPETTVTFADGRTAAGAVSGVDGDGDLAVLRVDTGGTPAPAWAEEAGAGPGTPVFAVTTLPGGGTRVTFGIVSATGQGFRGPRGRLIGDGLEHTAPLARGSSGSPVVDAAGRLVGLNTHRLEDGFYLAVPAGAELRGRIDALARGESPRRVRLGVALAPPHAARRLRAAVGLPERDGLLVRGVEEGGPADRAGVRRGDLIAEAGGRTVARPDDLYAVVDAHDREEALALLVVRGTEELSLRVTFAGEEQASA